MFEVESRLNGSKLTFGVRKSASFSCHTFSGLSPPTLVYTRNSFFKAVLASKDRAYINDPFEGEMTTSGPVAHTHGLTHIVCEKTLVACVHPHIPCGKQAEIFCTLNFFFDAHSRESWSWMLYLFDTFDPSLADEDCISVA